MQLLELNTIAGGRGVKGQGWVRETHLHCDPDGERDAVLHLLGFLIEILAELPNGDSSLHGKNKQRKR